MQNEPTFITTEYLASRLKIRAETLLEALSRNRKRFGDAHYYGVRPTKLASGRLAWPADSVERLTGGKGVE